MKLALWESQCVHQTSGFPKGDSYHWAGGSQEGAVQAGRASAENYNKELYRCSPNNQNLADSPSNQTEDVF